MNKHKDTDLPKCMTKELSGKIRLNMQIWSMQKNKPYALSCGVYPNVIMAAGAKEIVTDLIGTTPVTKKKFRKWQVIEAINKYRIDIGLNKLRQNYTK
jgi:hypothetical protein